MQPEADTSRTSPLPKPEPPTALPPSLFRSLVFGGTITIKLELAADELPSQADKSIGSYYIRARRISYLPLLLPQIRKHFLRLVLDHNSFNMLLDEQIWFSYNDAPLKWHWPIGLLHDFHYLAATPTSQSASQVPKPNDAVFIVNLHIANPPTDILQLGPSIEACQSTFMNMIKESDFMRHGSTKKIVNLRREQQDAIWDGVVQNDFEKYWNVASKIISLPPASASTPATTSSHPPSPNPSTMSPSPSTTRSPSPAFNSSSPDNIKLRSIPIRVYLPEGAPVLQDLAPPLTKQGNPLTLGDHLSTLAPLLYPVSDQGRTRSSVRTIVQGIEVPMEAHVIWLGSCLVGVDGWVNVVVSLE
ncbi:autophagy protein 5 [Microbotryomycetes sp. JL221]|nr:autophagy protein 5 [Microbotryomycetes sp. JL221]